MTFFNLRRTTRSKLKRTVSLRISRPLKLFLGACLIQVVFFVVLTINMITENRQDMTSKTNVLNKTKVRTTNKNTKHSKSSNLREIISEVTANETRYIIYRFDHFGFRKDRTFLEKVIDDNGECLYFSKSKSYFKDELPEWTNQKIEYEKDRFEEYGGRLVYLSDIQINPNRMVGKVGGEDLNKVINQSIDSELVKLKYGYFLYETDTIFKYELPFSFDLHKLADGLRIKRRHIVQNDKTIETIHKTAIITIRHEYANFYHTTMNWYDIFLIMVITKTQPGGMTVHWLDSHPQADIDEAWITLFGEVIRVRSLQQSLRYTHMIWNGIGSKSHINEQKAQSLPFVHEFRHFVLTRFSMADDHILDCNFVRVTIIWRHDHVFHPRNPSGFLSRKFNNEEEILNELKSSSETLDVVGVQLERLSMDDQLELITKTDILIGMHGAGLSHILYLPPTSGVIELFPSYCSPTHSHFRSMSKWRRLPYMSWYNTDKTRDSNDHRTTVPTSLLKHMVMNMKDLLCEWNN